MVVPQPCQKNLYKYKYIHVGPILCLTKKRVRRHLATEYIFYRFTFKYWMVIFLNITEYYVNLNTQNLYQKHIYGCSHCRPRHTNDP